MLPEKVLLLPSKQSYTSPAQQLPNKSDTTSVYPICSHANKGIQLSGKPGNHLRQCLFTLSF